MASDAKKLAIKNCQEQIFEILGKVGDEINELQKIDEAESGAQTMEQLFGEIRDIVTCLGEGPKAEEKVMEPDLMIEFNKEDFNKGDKGIGRGTFGSVYEMELRGQKVAVKKQKKQDDLMKKEIEMLRTISHDNIVEFRGWGKHDGLLFIVMELVEKNLLVYMKEMSLHESWIPNGEHDAKGLSSRITWEIAKQIAQAMLYLHSHDKVIVHADLKTDNVLIDRRTIIPKPKLCDFGLSKHEYLEQQVSGNDLPQGYIKFRPKAEEYRQVRTMDDLLKFDVLAFGLVIAHMKTGISPYKYKNTEELANEWRASNSGNGSINTPLSRINGTYVIRDIVLPQDIPDSVLGALIKKTYRDPSERPGFFEICGEFFGKDVKNPFNMSKEEFFECGFLKDTQIFVADSMVKEMSSDNQTEGPPTGYKSGDLICSVEVQYAPYHDKPQEKGLTLKYKDCYRKFRKYADEKIIDDNPAVALTHLHIDRSNDGDTQKILLSMKQKTYCHHRAMREIWRSFPSKEKKLRLEDLTKVNEIYSTSFGLHVAILTNEGPGEIKKFVFTQRSNKKGVASPGSYTCGAVESCSVKDYLPDDKVRELVPNSEPTKKYVSLINTAARGLEEELGLPLTGRDRDAVTLNTVYLKFDNHEWGMCGFVDLTSEKIREEHRFSFEDLTAAFTAGPKDRFEHRQIHGVDFKLRTMVEWIRENHDKLASSAKIVVVKVMEAFFGVAAVANEFRKKM